MKLGLLQGAVPLHSAGLEVLLHSGLLTEPYQGPVWKRGLQGRSCPGGKLACSFVKNRPCIHLLVLDAA